MRVLLIHPEDDPTRLAGVDEKFDLAFDLGTAAPSSYNRWSQLLGCQIEPLPAAEFEDFAKSRIILAQGNGRVIDDLCLDWWDLTSIEFYEPLLEVIRLRRFVERSHATDNIFVSRPSLQSRIVEAIFPGQVHELPRPTARWARVIRAARQISRLKRRQVLEVLEDKYDASYRLRRMVARRGRNASDPVVLLPSAYGNASQTQLAYASAVPELKFLLVATRRSGHVTQVPPNVTPASLARYAQGKRSRRELDRLVAAWGEFCREFRNSRELGVLLRTGRLLGVPRILQQGLAVRDAWLRVFEWERISAVLCADEMNWSTRLPALIARARGIATVACHHGALDVRYSIRNTSAERVLVKGAMERDYVSRVCGCEADNFEIGAPPRGRRPLLKARSRRDAILFFSEPYENFGARCRELYAEVLPGLAKLAQENGCELVLKLHPYESYSHRKRTAKAVLPPHLRHVLRIVSGRLEPALLDRARFALTITSTAAVDAALSNVPVFLCEWLNRSSHRYAEQFLKFRVAMPLESALQIGAIPKLLESFELPDWDELWQQIEPQRLRELLSGKTRSQDVAEAEAERVWA
jgi:hypothetical protein